MSKIIEQQKENLSTSLKNQKHTINSAMDAKSDIPLSDTASIPDSTSKTNNIVGDTLLAILISFAGLMVNVGFIIFLAWQAGYNVTW